jgi:RNA polymerase sigma-70 factor (ECF subfamily)
MDPSERVWRERCLHRAVMGGDEGAWRTWYEESFEGLYAYALWRCAGLRDRADEVVQETWLIAVRRIRQFDPDQGSFAGWLRGIAANVLRNHLRDRRRRGRQSAPPATSRTAESPDASLERREQAERIARALAALPEHYESALRAKYLDRLTVAEIAGQRGESTKAVESLLTRARQAFRDAFQKRERPDE